MKMLLLLLARREQVRGYCYFNNSSNIYIYIYMYISKNKFIIIHVACIIGVMIQATFVD